MLIRAVTIVIGMTALAATLAAAPRQSPAQKPVKELAGTIAIVGSDTMEPLLNRWSDQFRRQHPRVEFSIEARGSGTAAAALVEGRSQVAPMSRPMKAEEVASFGERYGYAPTGVRVAMDAVAVYVHASNPISGLTMEQLDGIFSAGQRCGGKRIERWKELSKNWRDDPIVIVGRDKLSGTHDFFRTLALCNGDFGRNYDAESDSSHVVWKIAQTPNAIGFAGVGYLTGTVKLVPLAKQQGDPYVPIIEEKASSGGATTSDRGRFANVTSGQYPLSRFLFIYVNKPPGKRLSPLIEGYLRSMLSTEGQETVANSGFIPLSDDRAADQLKRLEPGYLRPWWGQD